MILLSLSVVDPGAIMRVTCDDRRSSRSRLGSVPFSIPAEEPASAPTEAGVSLLRLRSYLVKLGAGAGGGGASF